MRRAAGVVILALVCAVAIPTMLARPAAAFTGATLTNNGAASGGPGTPLTYLYSWDAVDCQANGVLVGDTITILLNWDSPLGQIGSSTSTATVTDCSGTVSGQVPGNSSLGLHSPTASLLGVANSQATGTDSFTVPTPTPTPTPTRTPTPKPTPTPRPTPTHAVTPTPAPTVTAKPTPTPTPLPTPTPFVIGGGGGGSGGGSPQGGAGCSAGIGRSPTTSELAADSNALASPAADPTTLEIQLLSTDEYYHDAGDNNLGFVTRLYDDVLRHDPTPVEVATSLSVLSAGTDASRNQLVQQVVLSPEARAIRVDQAFHALLKTYPDAADLALWVNRLSSPGVTAMSSNTMVEEIAASSQYYAKVGGTAAAYMSSLYGDLLNVPPSQSQLSAEAAVMKQIQAGSAAARLTAAQDVVTSTQFRADEVNSYFANYMHQTCRELRAQDCLSTIGMPTTADLATDMNALASGTSEETIIAGMLGSDQYYQDHGSTQTGLIKAVYQDLIGRAPTDAELSSALATYTNDSLGHVNFVTAMVQSLAYQNLVVSLDYQQLLLRAPTAAELNSGQGILGGDVKSLQTPDNLLIESIAATPEFYGDDGGTDSTFVVNTISTLLMRPGTETQETSLLKLPLPHDATWQAAVTQSLVASSEYRIDFVRGIYAKFLTYSTCAVSTPSIAGNAGGGFLSGFFKNVPGGWFGLGIFVGVVVMGAAAVVFFTIERRRFARLYPNEVPRHRPE
jgi:outer membrane biosynthesis protein TonB